MFVEKTSAEWLDLLETANVPAGPIYKVDEMFQDPQVRHLGLAQTDASFGRSCSVGEKPDRQCPAAQKSNSIKRARQRFIADIDNA